LAYSGTGAPPRAITYVLPGDSASTIQSKLNSVQPGNTLVFTSGTYDFGGTTITGKSDVTVWADGQVVINNAPAAGTSGAFDFSGQSDWTIWRRRSRARIRVSGEPDQRDECNTTITNNFISRGSSDVGDMGVAVEMTGTGTVSGNTIANFSYAALTYQSGWNVSGDAVYNDGSSPYFGFANNGSGTGTFPPASRGEGQLDLQCRQ